MATKECKKKMNGKCIPIEIPILILLFSYSSVSVEEISLINLMLYIYNFSLTLCYHFWRDGKGKNGLEKKIHLPISSSAANITSAQSNKDARCEWWFLVYMLCNEICDEYRLKLIDVPMRWIASDCSFVIRLSVCSSFLIDSLFLLSFFSFCSVFCNTRVSVLRMSYGIVRSRWFVKAFSAWTSFSVDGFDSTNCYFTLHKMFPKEPPRSASISCMQNLLSLQQIVCLFK